ncbi:MAG: ABC transporter substrate-binding protein [Brevundimonas sp.]
MRTRRTLLAVTAGLAASTLLLSACGSDDPKSDDPGASGTGDASQVEVFTWWASGSEKTGLDALVKVFGEQHPETKFVNGAVAGGAGQAAKDLLQTRLQAGDPPDTFQAHAGAELTDYIAAGQLQDVSNLYSEFKLTDVFPKDLIARLTVDGKIYSVPSNIHRANVVWANPAVLKDAGLDPNAKYATIADWFPALDAVKAKGKTALSVAAPWTQVQLLETVLISDLGAEGYNGLWDGKTDWSGADVTKALTDFEKLMSYTNEDRAGLDWGDATAQVIDGTAGFNVMGDWAEAAFQEAKKVAPADYIYFPVPGTDGVFDFLADSFTLPVGAKHPGGTKNWLDTISSKDGQLAFNKAKGSIPARNDIDKSEFGAYQQTAIDSFGKDTIVSSLAHGAAAPITVLTAITDATSKFTTGATDLAQFQKDLVAAAGK